MGIFYIQSALYIITSQGTGNIRWLYRKLPIMWL